MERQQMQICHAQRTGAAARKLTRLKGPAWSQEWKGHVDQWASTYSRARHQSMVNLSGKDRQECCSHAAAELVEMVLPDLDAPMHLDRSSPAEVNAEVGQGCCEELRKRRKQMA